MLFCVLLAVQEEEEKNRGDKMSILTQHPTKITAATQNYHSTTAHLFSWREFLTTAYKANGRLGIKLSEMDLWCL